MATKAKVEPEVEEPEKEAETEEEKVDVNDPTFISKVAQAVKDLLKGDPEVEEEPEAKGKRPTARDEEERTNSMVRKAVQEFLSKADDKEKKEIKAEPEKVPGAKTMRKIENWLWGIE